MLGVGQENLCNKLGLELVVGIISIYIAYIHFNLGELNPSLLVGPENVFKFRMKQDLQSSLIPIELCWGLD